MLYNCYLNWWMIYMYKKLGLFGWFCNENFVFFFNYGYFILLLFNGIVIELS